MIFGTQRDPLSGAGDLGLDHLGQRMHERLASNPFSDGSSHHAYYELRSAATVVQQPCAGERVARSLSAIR